MATEEMIDELDSIGRFTGRVLPKSQIHHNGLWHLCGQVGATDGKGNVFTQRRGHLPSHMRNIGDPLAWAGHVSAYTGDPKKRPSHRALAIEAMLREADEEIGLKLPPNFFDSRYCISLPNTVVNQQTEGGWWDRTFNVNFMLYLPGLRPEGRRLEAGKVLSVAWTPIEQIEHELQQARLGKIKPKWAIRDPDTSTLYGNMFKAARQFQQNPPR